MEKRLQKQIRAIKNYARAMDMEVETAARHWCENGLAAQWAESN